VTSRSEVEWSDVVDGLREGADEVVLRLALPYERVRNGGDVPDGHVGDVGSDAVTDHVAGIGHDDLAGPGQGECFVVVSDERTALDGPSLGGVGPEITVDPVGRGRSDVGELEVADHLQRDRRAAVEFVLADHGEHAGLREQDRPHGEVGFLDRKPGDQDVDVSAAEPGERVDEGRVPAA
jgi:hypothetical protein